MNFEAFSFGSIRIDGVTYEHDVIIDRGAVRKRNKKPSKQFSRGIWTNAAIGRGGNPLGLQAPGHRDRGWRIASHGAGEA